MPRRQSSPREREERRDALLDAAMLVFREQGHEATVADIARTAGLAKGSFYTTFDSKEDLLLALRRRYIDMVVTHSNSIFERVGTEDLVALAHEMIESIIDFDLDQRDVVKLIARTSGGDAAAELAEANSRIDEIVEAGIRVGVAAGLFQVDDPKLTARLLNHAIHGLTEELILRDDIIDRDALVAAATTLVRRALSITDRATTVPTTERPARTRVRRHRGTP
jgi:AcrR family transcriptional regulator